MVGDRRIHTHLPLLHPSLDFRPIHSHVPRQCDSEVLRLWLVRSDLHLRQRTVSYSSAKYGYRHLLDGRSPGCYCWNALQRSAGKFVTDIRLFRSMKISSDSRMASFPNRGVWGHFAPSSGSGYRLSRNTEQNPAADNRRCGTYGPCFVSHWPSA